MFVQAPIVFTFIPKPKLFAILKIIFQTLRLKILRKTKTLKLLDNAVMIFLLVLPVRHRDRLLLLQNLNIVSANYFVKLA